MNENSVMSMVAELDAARYRWLIGYLTSNREDMDEALVACDSEDDFADLIDGELSRGAKHAK